MKTIIAYILLAAVFSFSVQAEQSGTPSLQNDAALLALFEKHEKREAFLKHVGQAMASNVDPQVIAEAKLAYGLEAGDTDYLRQNLPVFERTLKSLKESKTVRFKTSQEWTDKVAFVHELIASPPAKEGGMSDKSSEERLAKLEQQLAESQRLLEQLANNPPPSITVTMPQQPTQLDPRLGDPSLWKQVTQKSLGKVFISGKGWLVVGPNGPIDMGAKQQVGKVNTKEEVQARELAKGAAAAGMDVNAYAQMKQAESMSRERQRITTQIQSLTHEIRTLNNTLSR